jgi:putative hydrolases of HD superfamily
MKTRLEQQIQFIVESDCLKQVIRRNYNADSRRLENTTEHSWQITLMASSLAEYR